MEKNEMEKSKKTEVWDCDPGKMMESLIGMEFSKSIRLKVGESEGLNT